MAGNADYGLFYGLKEPPFSVSPDRRFLYLGRSVSAAYEPMIQALRRREGVVVVVGESGMGKTAVCRTIIESVLAPEHLSAIVDPLLSVDDLLRQILNDFAATAHSGREPHDVGETPHDLVVRLDRFLTSLPANHLAVVLVDDAHDVSVEILGWLRVLSNLEDKRGKKLQIVLIGQPTVEPLLERPGAQHLDQRIACRCRMLPLPDGEVERYVAFRLAMGRNERSTSMDAAAAPLQLLVVSDEAFAPFSKDAVRTLAIVSRTTPRTINLVADRALLLGFERQCRVLTPSVVRAAARSLDLPIPPSARLPRRTLTGAAAAIAIVASVCALVFWWHRLPSPLSAASRRVNRVQTASTARVSTPVRAPAPGAVTARTAEKDPTATTEEPLPRGEAYLLVVALFRVDQNAERLATTLREQSLPAFVRQDFGSGWYAVVVGPYASASEVNELKAQVASQFKLDGHIRIEGP